MWSKSYIISNWPGSTWSIRFDHSLKTSAPALPDVFIYTDMVPGIRSQSVPCWIPTTPAGLIKQQKGGRELKKGAHITGKLASL